MKKNIWLAGVLLAVIAVGAQAAVIKTIDAHVGTTYATNGTDGWNVGGLSDDGVKVACSQSGTNTPSRYYNLVANDWSATLFGNSYSHGVATWAGDGTYDTVNAVAPRASSSNPLTWNWNRTGGALATTIQAGAKLKDSAGNSATPSAFNAVSLNYSNGNGWMVGHTAAGAGVAYKITSGNVGSATGFWTTTGLGTTIATGGLNGVSNAGVAAGIGNNVGGAILADVANAGSVIDLAAFPGADAGLANGSATGISANATINGTISGTGFVGGYFKVGGYRHAFLTDLASGSDAVAALRLPIDGVYASNDEAEVFDVSNNGIAVGYDKVLGGVQTAAVWLPGTSQAVSLVSIMHETLPTDGSISRLSAIVSITADANISGVYTVAGQAVMTAGGTQAFVATISVPEPATLAFLALGGLAMLRRRR